MRLGTQDRRTCLFTCLSTSPPSHLSASFFLKHRGPRFSRFRATEVNIHQGRDRSKNKPPSHFLEEPAFSGRNHPFFKLHVYFAGFIHPYSPHPPRYDLSDLVDKLLWLRAHDAEAKQIALNAVAFAHRHLTCDGNIYYLDRLFRAYAAKLVP